MRPDSYDWLRAIREGESMRRARMRRFERWATAVAAVWIVSLLLWSVWRF